MHDLLLRLQELINEAADLAHDLPRGYREDQIKQALTGTNGEFFGDGLPDWIAELLERATDDEEEDDDEE